MSELFSQVVVLIFYVLSLVSSELATQVVEELKRKFSLFIYASGF